MPNYFIPDAVSTRLPNGAPIRLPRGIHPVPDVLANSAVANDLGIKPVEEMTADDYRSVGMKMPAPKSAPAPVPTPAPVAAPKIDTAASKAP